MGIFRSSLYSVVLASVVACGGSKDKPDALIVIPDAPIDAKVVDATPDAPSYDFSCLGQPLPTTATATVTLSGTAQTLNGTTLGPADGVAVQFFKGTTKVGATKTTDATGTFTSDPIATGGTPLNGFIHATKTGDRDTYVFPPVPVVADLMNVPVLIIPSATFDLIVTMLGVTQSPANGTVALLITDCQNKFVDGVSISVKQNGTEVAGTKVDIGSLVPQFAGTWFIFDVPPGNTEVNATYNGMTFHTTYTQTIVSHAGANATTGVRPTN